MPDPLREMLKAGPFNSVYKIIRNVKRTVSGEPIDGTVSETYPPLSIEQLLALAVEMPDHARLYFSLALGYIDRATFIDDRKGLACLRNASALNFESQERILLYSALIMARAGNQPVARNKIESIPDYEFIPEEQELKSSILHNQVSAHESESIDAKGGWDLSKFEEVLENSKSSSILIVGDNNAVTANCLPEARYFLASPGVTGIYVTGIARLGIQFELACGSKEDIEAVKNTGLLCNRWLTIPSEA